MSMKLGTYLTLHKIKQGDFAKLIGVSQVQIHRYCRGARIPRAVHVARIVAATGGAVTLEDFVGDGRQEEQAA
jgi:DNA-binding transcriptional regulator YdaS (Cro superfamily)